MRVLLVEDDSAIVRAIGDGLAGDAHVLRVCGDGSALSPMIDEEAADLLMFDADLKGFDCVAMCRDIRLKDSTNGHHTAVVVLTARHDLTSRLLAFSAGADDWLEKPVDRRELRTRLERWSAPPGTDVELYARRQQAMRGILRSIVHELNNPLAAAVMGVDLVLRRGNLPLESTRDLGVVRDNLDRISGTLAAVQAARE